MPTSQEVPLFPLNTVLFPGGVLPLRIFEPRYLDMVKRCMRSGSPFTIALLRAGRETDIGVETYEIGTLAQIVDFDQLPDQLLGITTRGTRRVRIHESHRQEDGLHIARVESLPLDPVVELPAEFSRYARLLEQALPQMGDFFRHLEPNYDDAGWVSARLTEVLPIALPDKQRLLEMSDPISRLHILEPMVRNAVSS